MVNDSLIAVIAHHRNGQVLPETFELIAFAQVLQEMQGGRIRLWMIGDGVERQAEVLARDHGVDVSFINCPGHPDYSAELYHTVLTDEFMEERPVTICAAHNSQGWDFVPGLAIRLDAACITGVAGLTREDGQLCFHRDLYGGKVRAKVFPRAATTVLTVAPGEFNGLGSAPEFSGSVERKDYEVRLRYTEMLGVKRAATETAALPEAEVVVAAGAGMGSQDNMGMVEDLARLFQRSAVAGSRIVCERGWLRYHQQVGMTGSIVAPKLYIACGISGAAQHVMGMRGAGFVVAINCDPQASIFNYADVCIVEDATRFIPLLLETRKKGDE